MLRRTVDHKIPYRGALAFRLLHHFAILLGVGAMVLGTVPEIAAAWRHDIDLAFDGALGFFLAEYLLRLYAVEGGRRRWAASFAGMVDAAAVLPLFLPFFGMPDSYTRLFGLLWMLKFVAYSEGLTLIIRVFRNAGDTLVSVFLVFVTILLAAATLAYLFERHVQPGAFGSIPGALWWAIVTGSTTGYGDVVPVTLPGRMLAGLMMISGAAIFAVWTGVLANGFAEEIRRREFLRTWDLVARVPYFHDVGAGAIAEVTRLLKPREFPADYTIMRQGEEGDCMYFVVSGSVRICLEPKPLHLGPGDFFGEIALITGGLRTATAVTADRCVLLELDVADFRDLAGRRPELMEVIQHVAKHRKASFATAGKDQATPPQSS